MPYRVAIYADFDSKEEAEAAAADMEEAAGKHNGELLETEIFSIQWKGDSV